MCKYVYVFTQIHRQQKILHYLLGKKNCLNSLTYLCDICHKKRINQNEIYIKTAAFTPG